jgi:hypothetical protein
VSCRNFGSKWSVTSSAVGELARVLSTSSGWACSYRSCC